MTPNELKKLQKTWYDKLSDNGFDDIEDSKGYLKSYETLRFSRVAPDTFAAKETYYRQAGQFLYEYKFATLKEKAIWALHAESISVRAIVPKIREQGFRTHKDEVDRTINRLRKEMKKLYGNTDNEQK